MSCMSRIVEYRCTQNCLTAPSITSGHPTGICESSRLSPLFSMIVPSKGTSIVTLRLTCSFLQFYASGARKPFSARYAKAGKRGCSSCGSISSLMTSLKPCNFCGGSWLGKGFCPCRDVSSSNHVGRMDLNPSSPVCFVTLTVSRRMLWYIGGTIYAGMKAVMN